MIVKSTRTEIRKRAAKERLTVGLDLGDRHISCCVVSEAGKILWESTLLTTKAGLGAVFAGMARVRIAFEAGTHSPWISRYLEALGHEVIVANTRNLAYITQSTRKNDRLDARKLAQLARVDIALLSPIRHRSQAAQADLTVLRGRDLAVRERNKLVASVRGTVKSFGERLAGCAPERAGVWLLEGVVAEEIQRGLEPLLQVVEKLNQVIAGYDREIEAMAQRYPEVNLLQQVYGVGLVIGLTFLLTIEDAQRFERSRDVGPYLGLRPKKRDSGASQPELSITKEGDHLLRWLLVQGAHTILRRGAPDSDLRRWGLGMLQAGETERSQKGQSRKGLKKKVVVAVARKLAVLLHHLWVSGEVYEPLHNARQRTMGAVA